MALAPLPTLLSLLLLPLMPPFRADRSPFPPSNTEGRGAEGGEDERGCRAAGGEEDAEDDEEEEEEEEMFTSAALALVEGGSGEEERTRSSFL